jgi:hypothetical protein
MTKGSRIKASKIQRIMDTLKDVKSEYILYGKYRKDVIK